MRGWRLVGLVGVAVLILASLAGAETVRSGGIQIGFRGSFEPRRLPRSEAAPVQLSLEARIAGADGAPLPRLRRFSIALNRAGRFDVAGLPVCRIGQIQPATTAAAEAACGPAVVGGGSFAARIEIDEQAPYPSSGRIVAFNGRLDGRPAVLLHVYGRNPVPTSYTLPLRISRSRGTFGTVLRASLAGSTPNAGRVTRLSLTLGRSFELHGRSHSYLSASCPAAAGSGFVTFPFARTVLDFGRTSSDLTVERGCAVRELSSAGHDAAGERR